MRIERQRALITGANGGMGRAFARAFGETRDLILTDRAAEPLAAFTAQLRDEGYTISAALPGELGDDGLIANLADQFGAGPSIFVHTAALSPALADWQSIIQVNLVVTRKLLDALEERLTPGCVGILIASMAGHIAPADPELDGLMRDAFAPDLLARLETHLRKFVDPADTGAFRGMAYSLSKRAVMRMCAERSTRWYERGARIVSISPGSIWTPMGRREAEESPLAEAVAKAAPAGRWGTPMDIVAAGRFLASPEASFITGTDLRVDGGITPYVQGGGKIDI